MGEYTSVKYLAKHDLPQFYLLIILYFLQGIPVGLAFGTIPFLLKSTFKDTSFTQLGLFSIATYPYSLKILWSPFIDSIYNKSIGRRRSWIIPIQFVSGFMLLMIGFCISKGWIFKGVDSTYGGPKLQPHELIDIVPLTICFMILIFLCATQDIAVDGWALTILSTDSLSYASTAQTFGLNIGYFLSFTIFLTFNSSDFMNKYFRSVSLEHGLISLSGYLKIVGVLYILVTIYVVYFTNEDPYQDSNLLPSMMITDKHEKNHETLIPVKYNQDLLKSDNTSISYVYSCFFKILKLPTIQSLMFIHFIAKFSFQCNEGATNLKLLEKGFKKEDLSITVLIDFPFELIFGYYVARWSSDSNYTRPKILHPILHRIIGNSGILTPWLIGFCGRLLASMMGSYVVYKFPSDKEISSSYFFLVIIQHLIGSFMSTVQFVSMCAFHTRIADPVIGGTYMTLLNTLSNLGGTWPRLFIMSLIDYFTIYDCQDLPSVGSIQLSKEECLDRGGNPIIISDGYYITNTICIIIGILLFFGYIKRKIQYLQFLPVTSWRCE